MKKFTACLLVCYAHMAQAQSIKQLKQEMDGIASDATGGRFTGSPGYLKAAKYVARELKNAGIKTNFQAVPFIWDNYDGSTITIRFVVHIRREQTQRPSGKSSGRVAIIYSTTCPLTPPYVRVRDGIHRHCSCQLNLPGIIWIKFHNPFNAIFVSKHSSVCTPGGIANGSLNISAY